MPSEAIGEPSGRKYRSKKQRPCDLCRSRKIQCKLQGSEPACELCRRLERRCTFVSGPVARKYRQTANAEGVLLDDRAVMLAAAEQHDDMVFGDITMWQDGTAGMMMQPEPPFWNPLQNPQSPFRTGEPSGLMANNWAAVDLAMGGLPQDTSHSLPGPRAGFSRGGLPISASPNSRGTAPTTLSNESPSTAPDVESQHSAKGMEFSMEFDFNTSPRNPRLGVDSVEAARRPSVLDADGVAQLSLESWKGHSNQLIGLSSESDPYLLRHYYYNSQDVYLMFRLHFRKVVDDSKLEQSEANSTETAASCSRGPIPTQFLLKDEAVWKDELKAAERSLNGNQTEQNDIELLEKLVPAGLGSRLFKLYTKWVHPRHPVLSLSDLENIPTSDDTLVLPIGLRSAVYALAAPFTFLDDELSVSKSYLQVPTEDLWAITQRSYHRASRLSHLSLIQLCLLLLQMQPLSYVAAEPPSFWALSCSALAIAENLGLNLDPSDWRLPRREIALRRRLWWFTYSAHTWHALVSARSSHINDANWHVSSLQADDFEGEEHPDVLVRASILREIPLCLAQCSLSTIAADVLKEFYTIRATIESPSLSSYLSRAQPLRARIESWRQSLPLLSKPSSELSEEEFDDGAALRLSHLTVEILIFRALLRPLSFKALAPGESSREPVSTIFENCYTCAKIAAEIVSSLRAKHFATFWPHYARYQLCYVSTFILMNLAQSASDEMALRNYMLLNKWRDTLRMQARAWPLARLACIRLDAVFWKGLALVAHGEGPDSPAMKFLKSQGFKSPEDNDT